MERNIKEQTCASLQLFYARDNIKSHIKKATSFAKDHVSERKFYHFHFVITFEAFNRNFSAALIERFERRETISIARMPILTESNRILFNPSLSEMVFCLDELFTLQHRRNITSVLSYSIPIRYMKKVRLGL